MTLAGIDGRPSAPAPVIEKVIADLARLIVQQHLDHPVLIGHSLGGYIGYRFAIEHPDLVGRLVAIEGFPVFPPLTNADVAGRRAAAQKLADALTGGGTPQAFHASMRDFLEARMNDPKEADRLAVLASRSDPKAVAEYILEMLPSDLRPDLVKLKAPVLEIVAANSYLKGSSESDIRAFYTSMLADAPQAKVVTVPDARHFVMLDQPDAVYQSIRQFLEDAGQFAGLLKMDAPQ
ncbi:alpha/beta hydrolase [Paraburkholderia bryophila]|uniref:alpha/beta fold hydrolase n=1 Tax=Paraburkholderia bryophila TaxID=420952 RepID=UPI0038B74B16